MTMLPFLEQQTTDTIYSAVVGFILSLTPLSCSLLGWRGAGGLAADK
jgi:hypothetical protein